MTRESDSDTHDTQSRSSKNSNSVEKTYAQQQQYIKQLEEQLYNMQQSHIALIVRYNRVLCRVQQIINATPWERCQLIEDLKSVVFASKSTTSISDEIPSIRCEARSFGSINRKCDMMFATLRSVVGEFNQAYNNSIEAQNEYGAYSDSQMTLISKRGSNHSKGSKSPSTQSQSGEQKLLKSPSKASKNSKGSKESNLSKRASKHSKQSFSRGRTSTITLQSKPSGTSNKGSKK